MLTLAKFFLKEIYIPVPCQLGSGYIVRVWASNRNEVAGHVSTR